MQLEGAAISLGIGAVGWNRPDWITGFYPADLPGEWRLSYYANEFDTIFVPAGLWDAVKRSDVKTWRDDVSERFGFYIELVPAGAGGSLPEGTLSKLDELRETLHGIVLRTFADATLKYLGRAIRYRYPGRALVTDQAGESGIPRLWRPGLMQSSGTVGVAGLEAPPDAMALRRLIEAFLEASSGPERMLFLDAPHETLETAGTIARLLGY